MWTGSGAMCSSTANATPARWAPQRSTRSSATFELVDRHASWSWTATHISALRTVFDNLGGMTLTAAMPTPKRPRRLHGVLSPDEVARLLRAAGSTRDRLAILLLYGCWPASRWNWPFLPPCRHLPRGADERSAGRAVAVCDAPPAFF